VLRLFRRAAATERALAQAIAEELRAVDYKAAGTLQRSVDSAGRLSRNDWEALLNAMVRAGLIEIEEAEYERDGEVKHFRKVRLTAAGLEMRASTPVELLLSDGVVEEFGGRGPKKKAPTGAKSGPLKNAAARKAELAPLTAAEEEIETRLKEWRATEAQRLRVPAFVVLHDRTLRALAQARPENPRQLLEIDGIGPAKVDRFGGAILEVCARERLADRP
jgi:superfamily II DNA helicase RecQ